MPKPADLPASKKLVLTASAADLLPDQQELLAPEKGVEQRQKSIDESFNQVLKTAGVTVVIQDMQLRHLELHNPYFVDDVNAAVGKTDYDLFPRHEAEMLAGLKRDVMATGKSRTHQVTFNRNGRSIDKLLTLTPVRNSRGVVTGVATVASDITLLREANRKTEFILESLEEAHFSHDDNGRLWGCNEAACRMYGYTREEFLDLWVGDLDAVMTPADVRDAMARITEAGHARFETKNRRKDGTIFDSEVSVTFTNLSGPRFIAFARDITERKQAEEFRSISIRLLAAMNAAANKKELVHSVVQVIVDWLKCEAVGVRLRDHNDYPYYETRGFAKEFVLSESRLCALDDKGGAVCDYSGNPVLECMCGNVLCGRFDPSLPFFTEYGSFWTNSTTKLLASTAQAERQARTRNRCHGEGYESVALIPLKCYGGNLGLLQINDHRPNFFTRDLIQTLERLMHYVALAVSRQTADEAYHESQTKYQQIVETAEEGIWMIDTESRTIFVNRQMAEMIGYTVDDMMGRRVAEFVFPDDLNLIASEIQSQLSGHPAQLEHRLIHRSGRIVWCQVTAQPNRDSDGTVVGAFAMFTDITQRKRAEDAARASESKYQRLHSSMIDAYVLVDMKGAIREYNESYRAMLGYTDEELVKLTYVQLTPEIWHHFEQQIIDSQVLVRGYSDIYEKEYRRKDGTIFPIELRTFLLRNEDGQPESMWAIVRDITERKHVDLQVRALNARLEAGHEILMGKNAALKEILNHIEEERNQTKARIAANKDKVIAPILKSLKNRLGQNHEGHILMLEKALEEITHPFVNAIASRYADLSPREIEVCTMIRNGLLSKEIADCLSVSIETVHKFRQRIRQKLGITTDDVDLRTYLNQM